MSSCFAQAPEHTATAQGSLCFGGDIALLQEASRMYGTSMATVFLCFDSLALIHSFIHSFLHSFMQ